MAVPRYQEIKTKLLEEIENKPINSPIASERELASIFHASRMTVRNAINELVEEGYLYRNKNKGTFVADRTLTKRNTPMESLLAQENGNFLLVHLNIKELPEIAAVFQVPPGDKILRIVRLNKKEGRPISVEEFFFVYERVEQRYLKDLEQLLDVHTYLENGKMIQRFYPVILPVKYANLLELKLNTPMIMVESTIYNPDGGVKLLVHAYHNPKESPIEIIS